MNDIRRMAVLVLSFWLVSCGNDSQRIVLAQDAKHRQGHAPIDMRKRAQELKELKFGMFICWSFATFMDKEWPRGVKDLSVFSPSGTDTDQWARVAREAGMGYILFLTKHHPGFCLWDTQTTTRRPTEVSVTSKPLNG